MEIFNVKTKREKELIEKYQEKINKVRDDSNSTIDDLSYKLSSNINIIVALKKEKNELKQSLTDAQINVENKLKKEKYLFSNEKEQFDIWMKNQEDLITMKKNNLDELAKKLKEESEKLAKAKFADLITDKFDVLVKSIAEAKSSDTLMIGDTKKIKKK